MKISLHDTETRDKGEFLAQFYLTKDQSKAFNALLVTCRTRHYKTRLKNATRMYIVTEGNGIFIIDSKEYTAEKYDCFLIGHDQVYEYAGSMKLVEINVPATDKSNEERLK